MSLPSNHLLRRHIRSLWKDKKMHTYKIWASNYLDIDSLHRRHTWHLAPSCVMNTNVSLVFTLSFSSDYHTKSKFVKSNSSKAQIVRHDSETISFSSLAVYFHKKPSVSFLFSRRESSGDSPALPSLNGCGSLDWQAGTLTLKHLVLLEGGVSTFCILRDALATPLSAKACVRALLVD